MLLTGKLYSRDLQQRSRKSLRIGYDPAAVRVLRVIYLHADCMRSCRAICAASASRSRPAILTALRRLRRAYLLDQGHLPDAPDVPIDPARLPDQPCNDHRADHRRAVDLPPGAQVCRPQRRTDAGVTPANASTPSGSARGGACDCQKVLLFDKGVCGLTAAHAAVRRLRRTARTFAGREVFSSPHMSPKKMIGLSFTAPLAKAYEVFWQAVIPSCATVITSSRSGRSSSGSLRPAGGRRCPAGRGRPRRQTPWCR